MKTSGIKILALQGSNRKNGKTTTLLNRAVATARENGNEVTVVNLPELNIGYCKGCMKCDEAGECIFRNDDMPKLTKQIREADVIILAAPVYWGNVPAVVKNIFDRMRGASMEETKTFPRPKLSGKRYILLTACNTVMPFAKICGQSSGIERVVREYFKTAGVKKAGTVVCSNAIKHETVPERLLRKTDKIVNRL